MVAGQAVPSGAEVAPREPLSREEVHAGFAAALRDGMAATALRQRELANRVGVSPGRISQYLNDPKKMPARWARIVELLAAAGAPVEVFSERFGSFWPDHPGPSPAPAAATPAVTDVVDEPEPTDTADETTRSDDDDAADEDGGATGQDDNDRARERVEVPGALEAATMADAYAARTGLVLPAPLTDEPPQVHSDLEVATEAGLRVVPEKRLVAPPGSGTFPAPRSVPIPVPRPVPDAPSGPCAPSRPTDDDSTRVFVDDAPTGPLPSASASGGTPSWWRHLLPNGPVRVWIAAGIAALLVVGVPAAILSTRTNPTPRPVAVVPVPLLLGVVEGAGPQGLTERTFPSKAVQHRTTRTIADGAPVAIDCAQTGDSVVNGKATGYSTSWLRLQDGFWVTSVFVRVAASTVNSCAPGPPLPLGLTPR